MDTHDRSRLTVAPRRGKVGVPLRGGRVAPVRASPDEGEATRGSLTPRCQMPTADSATGAPSRLDWIEATPTAIRELMERPSMSRQSEEGETIIRWGTDGVSIWTCVGADLRGLLRRAGSGLRRFAADAGGVRLDFEPGALRDAQMVVRNLDGPRPFPAVGG